MVRTDNRKGSPGAEHSQWKNTTHVKKKWSYAASLHPSHSTRDLRQASIALPSARLVATQFQLQESKAKPSLLFILGIAPKRLALEPLLKKRMPQLCMSLLPHQLHSSPPKQTWFLWHLGNLSTVLQAASSFHRRYLMSTHGQWPEPALVLPQRLFKFLKLTG